MSRKRAVTQTADTSKADDQHRTLIRMHSPPTKEDVEAAKEVLNWKPFIQSLAEKMADDLMKDRRFEQEAQHGRKATTTHSND